MGSTRAHRRRRRNAACISMSIAVNVDTKEASTPKRMVLQGRKTAEVPGGIVPAKGPKVMVPELLRRGARPASFQPDWYGKVSVIVDPDSMARESLTWVGGRWLPWVLTAATSPDPEVI